MRNGKRNARKRNRRYSLRFSTILYTAALVLTLSLTAYLVYARYVHQTDDKSNDLTESYVSCAGTEEMTEVTEISGTETVTKTHKTSLTVTNTGNVTSYIRVQLVSYWQNASGNIVARNSVTPVGAALASGATVADATTDSTFVLNNDWIAVEASDGTWYYYYTKPVAAGDETPSLIMSGSYITLVTEDGYYQVVEVLAEAIQAEPADAVKSAWTGITVETDGTLKAK